MVRRLREGVGVIIGVEWARWMRAKESFRARRIFGIKFFFRDAGVVDKRWLGSVPKVRNANRGWRRKGADIEFPVFIARRVSQMAMRLEQL